MKSTSKTILIIWEAVSVILLAVFLSIALNPLIGILGASVLGIIFWFCLKEICFKTEKIEGMGIFDYINVSVGAILIGNAFSVMIGFWSIKERTVISLMTGFSFAMAVFFPMLYIIGRKQIRSGKECKKSFSGICLSAASIVLLFLVFVDIPSELFLTNNTEFTFSYWDMMKSFYPVVSLLMAIVPVLLLLPDVVKNNAAILMTGITACFYVQNMFFNRYIGEINGARYNWKEHIIYTLICTLVWIIILGIAFWMAYSKKNVKIHTFAVGAIFVLVFCSFLFVVIRSPKENFRRKQYYLDSSEQFTIGSEKNVVVLIADAVDNDYVKQIYEEKPELFEPFRDFAMYTDTCSVYDITNQSIEQMFYNYTQKDGTQNTGLFFGRFRDEGYRILMFHAGALGLDMEKKPVGYIDNYIYTDDTKDVLKVNYEKIRLGMTRVSLFKAFPCMLKGELQVENVSFASCIAYETSKYELINDNYEFEDHLELTANEESDRCFIYQHLGGAHFPCDDYIGESEHCLKIYADYIEQMKKIGSYDDSVIIIAADHGRHDDAEGIPFGIAATPMFMVKRAGEHHDSIDISSKPLYYRDIQATILKYAGLYDEDCKDVFGKTIDDYSECDIRTRVWFDQGFIHNGIYRKYTYRGDSEEFKRVVEEGLYEEVPDGSFDFSELE